MDTEKYIFVGSESTPFNTNIVHLPNKMPWSRHTEWKKLKVRMGKVWILQEENMKYIKFVIHKPSTIKCPRFPPREMNASQTRRRFSVDSRLLSVCPRLTSRHDRYDAFGFLGNWKYSVRDIDTRRIVR